MSFSNITAYATYLIKTFGYLGVGVIVFAESGLILGFILPGDSLLFVAGLLAAQNYFNIYILIAVIFVAAVAGDNVGYILGTKLGRRVFSERNTFLFNPENLRKTEAFFERYGKSTFILQRFVPIIRAFAPLLGGVGKMSYRTFFIYDVIGCALWSAGITILGYFLGAVIPNIDTYLLPIILVVVVVSLLPTIFTYRKNR